MPLTKSKRTAVKSAAVRIAAGMAAILISPPLASYMSKNTDVIAAVWEGEKTAVAQRASASGRLPLSLEMNNSLLIIYRPSPTGAAGGDAEVIAEALPPLSFHEDMHETDDCDDPFNQPAAQVFSQNISDLQEEMPIFSETDGRIVKTNFGPNGGSTFLNLDKAGQVRNSTELGNDFVLAQSRILPEIKLELNGEPEVLIFHTHTTEAFQPCGYDYFDSSYNGRSKDSGKNIVAVGAEIAKSFAASGITVIHDGTFHDYPRFSGAYSRSAETVRQILKAYPSIKVVLDIHRDAITGADGARVAPVTLVNGENAAQVMILSAADDGTFDIPDYLQNFRLASLFQQQMEYDNPGITRPIWFQYSQFNQHIMPGSLLIEVGAHGNTLEEAKLTGRLIGRSMAAALLSL